LRAHVRGTYAARADVVGKAPAAPAAQAPVDALDVASLLTGHGGAGKYAFRGCEAIIARFYAKGIEFLPVGDGAEVLVTAAGGTFSAAHRNEIQLVAPLLTAYLVGVHLKCQVTPDCRREVRTLAVALPAPVFWCGDCGGPS
jgi:hypothetical protein